MPLRGGNWTDHTGAGVFALDLIEARARSLHNVGFRSALAPRSDSAALWGRIQHTGIKGPASMPTGKK